VVLLATAFLAADLFFNVAVLPMVPRCSPKI
jgi:hypothetical protein